MSKPLVIVESPAKAKKISEFLGGDYVVEASVGHIRDLPSKGLSIDVDSDFKTEYEVNPNKKDVIKRLKALLKDADELYLATDEDREGEAIAWHLQEVLKPKVPVRRMVFHEITRGAIEHAVENARDIDYHRVDAQETRRIVDRLYGYPVSQIMWRKVNRGLSAGRVQSPAVRLVVERERERIAFVAADYWDLTAAFPTDPAFTARLVALDGKRVATGRDFGQDGRVTRDDVAVVDEPTATSLRTRLDEQRYTVRSIDEKPWRSRPKPPFMTSTLQQEGGRKLRMSANQVMRIAQGLYEKGYITYMRTDSTTLSQTAIDAARSQVRELYGADYVPAEPRQYAGKSKNAQEAHEAIRPAGETFRTPDQVKGELRKDELGLYDLIWKRTVASQMEDAVGRTISMRIVAEARADDGQPANECTFGASGRVITFPGYLKAYVEDSDDDDAERDDAESVLPAVTEGDALPTPALTADGHTTSPPARFTEASLVKRMEELGIGRPSTYASIMTTIQDRGYVFKKGNALVPTWTAFAVVNVLERQFGEYVDYEFTAKMEDDLDLIAVGQEDRVPYLKRFWFGDDGSSGGPGARKGLSVVVDEALEKVDAAEVNTFPLGMDENGEMVVAKPGRYGPYVKRGDDDTASIPEGLPPDELTLDKALELLAAPKGDEPIGEHPESGLPVYVKTGRYGPYVQLGDQDTLPPDEKPKMESLLKDMKPEEVTLDDALRLLSLPRVVGTDEETGLPVLARNGRYGPYISKGDEKGADARSLESEDELFTVDMARAKALFAEPKRRRGQAAPKPPLRELGDDPVSEKPVVVKDGRFGPYVTDGETNASLRKGDLVEEITIERAAELLQIRRETNPPKKKAGARKKATKKKATKKKTAAKKSVAKKKATKKASE
ncbi:type I DNA topoisomerase [Acidimicrobiia bacterium EGI L10123]|uniref:type I DNA topoisomerase n=1 Tax=Salinilacustrithrix flava TaxID=2957203 RepID=UPI003D7C2490|nr:type I DNA topoisomerase [Acidimicrobiia bacterium EGI L10123]